VSIFLYNLSMGRGENILFGKPLAIKKKARVIKKMEGYFARDVDCVFALRGGNLRLLAESKGGPGEVVEVCGQSLRYCSMHSVEDLTQAEHLFLSDYAIVWMKEKSTVPKAAFAPSFEQTWNFAELKKGAVRGLCFSNAFLFALVAKDGNLSLEKTQLSKEWTGALDEKGDLVENILSYAIKEDGMLLLHRKDSEYRLSYLDESSHITTFPLETEEVFSSDFRASLQRFSYEKDQDGFYYLDEQSQSINLLCPKTGSVKNICQLSAPAQAFLRNQDESIVLYENGFLEIFSRDGKSEFVSLKRPFQKMVSLDAGKVLLCDQGKSEYEIISF
jgi:hypothetical protein